MSVSCQSCPLTFYRPFFYSFSTFKRHSYKMLQDAVPYDIAQLYKITVTEIWEDLWFIRTNLYCAWNRSPSVTNHRNNMFMMQFKISRPFLFSFTLQRHLLSHSTDVLCMNSYLELTQTVRIISMSQKTVD